MPDFSKFEDIDIYISGEPTVEGDRLLSEYIKAYKAKEARKKARLLVSRRPSAISARKKAKAVAK